jgi:hypothetical protein
MSKPVSSSSNGDAYNKPKRAEKENAIRGDAIDEPMADQPGPDLLHPPNNILKEKEIPPEDTGTQPDHADDYEFEEGLLDAEGNGDDVRDEEVEEIHIIGQLQRQELPKRHRSPDPPVFNGPGRDLPVPKPKQVAGAASVRRQQARTDNDHTVALQKRVETLEKLMLNQLRKKPRFAEDEGDGVDDAYGEEDEALYEEEEVEQQPFQYLSAIDARRRVLQPWEGHPHSQPLTPSGKQAREIMEEYFGDLNTFTPLTFTLQKPQREEIGRAGEETEEFFPPIREIEKAMVFPDKVDTEREKQLYKQVSSMKQLYQMQMGMVQSLANGDQDMIARQTMELVAVTLDTATQANLDRLTLRAGPVVADTLRHRDEEAVFQQEYKDIATQRASEARDLQALLDIQMRQNKPSLRRWGPMRPGYIARTARRGSHGRSRPLQKPSKRWYNRPRHVARPNPPRTGGFFGQPQNLRHAPSQQQQKPFLGVHKGR